MDMFTEKVRNTISEHDMIPVGGAVVAALSGGADSVSLLFALNKLSQELDFTLSACHVNHGLRGEESDGDMRFCQELCDRLGIELRILNTDVRDFQKKHESIEETARRVRYDFFAEVSQGKKLATAHNCDDSAETVLLNMMRGTGLKGLCGIPPVRGNIIRPLIRCTRDEVESYCNENALGYVTDKTNLSDDYTRNKVRHAILPEIMKINSSFLETASRMQQHLREDSELLESMAAQALDNAKTEGGYKAAEISALPKPIRTRVIKKILSNGGIEPSTLRINMTDDILLVGKGKINPCRNRFVIVKKGIIYVEAEQQIYKKHIHIHNNENE